MGATISNVDAPASAVGGGVTVATSAVTSVRSGRRWSWPHYLALFGAPILFWETWTIVAWLRAGPTQITEYRDHDSVSWYAAHVLEALVILTSLVVIVHVVRGCRREGRILTFDVMFCLCGATIFWGDALTNFYVPMYLPTSNFVNLNYVGGHMPFVVNPDMGMLPDPLLFSWPLATFGLLGLAIVVGPLVDRVRRRWPGLSTIQLVGLVFLVGCVIDIVVEVVIMLPLKLQAWAAPDALTLDMGNGFRFPLLEVLCAGAFFSLPMAVHIFKDDRGRRFVERGLDRYSERARKAISLLALYGTFQAIVFFGGNSLVILSPYVNIDNELPPHIVNGMCDSPGTRSGPCPGSPGFRDD